MSDKKLTGAFTVKFKTENGKEELFKKYNLSNFYPFNLKFGMDLLFYIRPSKNLLDSLFEDLSKESEVEWIELEWFDPIGSRS